MHHEFPIEGVDAPLSAVLDLHTIRQGDHVFAQVYIDRYKPGECRWILSDVWALVTDPAGQTGRAHLAMSDEYYRDYIKVYGPDLQLIPQKVNPAYTTTEQSCDHTSGALHCGIQNNGEYQDYREGPRDGSPVPIYSTTRVTNFRLALPPNAVR